MSERRRVLVVDDDAAIRDGVASLLADAGYEVSVAGDGAAAVDAWERLAPDLVLTDLAMPRADGFHVVREVRRRGATPILVLSVRGELDDKVRALDLGADDYVTKPFSSVELLARVRALLRRAAPAASAVLLFPGLELDRDRRQVRVEGHEVKLTPTELAILEVLAGKAGRPVTPREIIAAVWRGAPGTSVETVRVHVGSLRRKLEPDPANPRFIATEPWVGYRFLPEPL
jgi:two-component system KDP operon response regulator KdpE